MNINLIHTGGIGDILLGFQIEGAFHSKEFYTYWPYIEHFICARQEVFDVVDYLFTDDMFRVSILPEEHGDSFINNFDEALKLQECHNIDQDEDNACYVVTPDLLFKHPHAFIPEQHNLTAKYIREQRVLFDRTDIKKEIYLGLMSTTEGYTYQSIGYLAAELAKALPDYKIHLPIVTVWANKRIHGVRVPQYAPDNLIVYENPNFIDQIEILKKCCYAITTCNGISHIAYQFGCPRLLLDPVYGRLPWIARWKSDYGESVPIQTSVPLVVELVKTHLMIPQTMLVPHINILEKLIIHKRSENINWTQELILKY